MINYYSIVAFVVNLIIFGFNIFVCLVLNGVILNSDGVKDDFYNRHVDEGFIFKIPSGVQIHRYSKGDRDD